MKIQTLMICLGLIFSGSAFASEGTDEYGRSVGGQRVENNGSGFCTLYRTVQDPDGHTHEIFAGYYPCAPASGGTSASGG